MLHHAAGEGEVDGVIRNTVHIRDIAGQQFQVGVFDRTHAVADSRDLQMVERGRDRRRAAPFAGMGGEMQDVEVSALQKLNLEALKEAIGLQAELLELKANPGRAASGAVVEAKLDKGRGPVATLLVQKGTLKRVIKMEGSTQTAET